MTAPLNLLIPMAGQGTQFRRAGYDAYKPFVEIFGKPMIQYVLDAFPPHVTLVHPRTSRRGGDFRTSGWSLRGDEEFMAQEVAITALDGAKWVVLKTFRLRGEGERRS